MRLKHIMSIGRGGGGRRALEPAGCAVIPSNSAAKSVEQVCGMCPLRDLNLDINVQFYAHQP